MEEHITHGTWTEEKLDRLLTDASLISDQGERIVFISEKFIGTPYRDSTLSGGVDTPEVFTINLAEVDCLTFIEYVEAMRRSGSFAEFRENLRMVRYVSGAVDFKNRRHFFTDWENTALITDATKSIGGDKCITAGKTLNKKEDGSSYVPGIPPQSRDFTFIPSEHITEEVVAKLRTGDYAGIYSGKAGLDVSHVGIIIKKENGVFYLRHASTREDVMKVMDEDLIAYMKSRDGLIVLRPLEG